ncbi:TPM domain-containing protein [Niabella drilacis]|uniref:TLP18.3, Psb32 and MOLO-1 founding protein of phosphatase n=1 Tax=Niabella drilacis (strain DSM 25811 / CCM 8410 / CCUG 62505 / LMG 26954 / E90) TaxID=1285928 RepID=A0A1G7B1V2_NIADE|nr:TPM domain-containing protein [Niabella drilacis]SDE20922.1 TLP18.3, Psb32 and MOLO-1 founding protein of phosphatase [Niabella drilacis]
MQQKVFQGILFFTTGLMLSCSSGRNLDTQVHKRDGDGRDVNIKYPQQQTITPQNINMSYDFEQLFTAAQNKKIDSLARVFEKSNLISIRVTTLPADKVTAGSFENHNKSLLKEWAGVHGNTDKALVISISKALNKAAIDYGPFVGKLLSRQEAGQIINNDLLPAFQSGSVYDATLKALSDLMDTIRRNIK